MGPLEQNISIHEYVREETTTANSNPVFASSKNDSNF